VSGSMSPGVATADEVEGVLQALTRAWDEVARGQKEMAEAQVRARVAEGALGDRDEAVSALDTKLKEVQAQTMARMRELQSTLERRELQRAELQAQVNAARAVLIALAESGTPAECTAASEALSAMSGAGAPSHAQAATSGGDANANATADAAAHRDEIRRLTARAECAEAEATALLDMLQQHQRHHAHGSGSAASPDVSLPALASARGRLAARAGACCLQRRDGCGAKHHGDCSRPSCCCCCGGWREGAGEARALCKVAGGGVRCCKSCGGCRRRRQRHGLEQDASCAHRRQGATARAVGKQGS